MAAMTLLASCGGTASAPASGSPSAAQPAASARTSAANLQTMKIAIPNKGLGLGWLDVAQALGYFERQGLRAEVTAMPPATSIAALQAGELDYMTSTGSATRAILSGNVPIRIVYIAANRPGFLLVGAKGITDVSQLRGKVVAGYAPQNTVNAVLVELLRRRGLDPSQYTLVNAGADDGRGAAIVNGVASATIFEVGSAVPFIKQGYPVLANAAEQVEVPFTGLIASTAALQAKRDFMKRGMAAVIEGQRTMRTQKDQAVPILAKAFDLGADDVARILDELQPGWSTDGRPSAEAIKFEFQQDMQDMKLSSLPREDQIYDFSLLDELSGKA
ncbi:MAG TPA: ABC transporter substrate-binding protein [Chloroflexota bacterium]|nr:ABC transporter substrate-binding protein [Chloroflexota bacterium]